MPTHKKQYIERVVDLIQDQKDLNFTSIIYLLPHVVVNK